jgi:hypothetical protein
MIESTTCVLKRQLLRSVCSAATCVLSAHFSVKKDFDQIPSIIDFIVGFARNTHMTSRSSDNGIDATGIVIIVEYACAVPKKNKSPFVDIHPSTNVT